MLHVTAMVLSFWEQIPVQILRCSKIIEIEKILSATDPLGETSKEGIPVGRHSGGRLATTLVANKNAIFSLLARACGVPAVGVRAVDCWQ